jgi:trigger factor
MKADLTDVSDTKKSLSIEIPREVVDAEIDKVARRYTRQVQVPGFRPGKVPAGVVKQRFREQILHDVMHGLIPRAVDEALTERNIEPVDEPDIRNVALAEGQPLTFTAEVETVPPLDPGDLSTIQVTRPAAAVTDEAVERALQQLRERAATLEAVEGRPVAEGDTLVADVERRDPDGETSRHEGVPVELGSSANPPGFDEALLGLEAGASKTFDVHFPESYAVAELAGRQVTYTVQVKEIRRRRLPELDDEFAKDLGDFESLAALGDRVRRDLEAEAEARAERHVRGEVLRQLASRMRFDPPASLIDREIERRMEELVRQLMQQQIDPRQAGIDWAEFREAQREPARTAVASALMLDAIAQREALTIDAEEVDREIEQIAARANRPGAVVRAQLEQEGARGRLAAGLRRERAVDLAVSRATITSE